MTNVMSRRNFGRMAAATIAGAAIAPTSLVSCARMTGTAKTEMPVLTFAHLTDIHVQPERMAAEGLTACLHHVQKHPSKPSVILTGGDTIMDSMGATHDRTKLQWDLWQRIMKSENSLPVNSCIGNHDVWGWNRKSSFTTGKEMQYGKKWVMEMFGMERPYRSYDQAGWHFIILDSTFPDGKDGYVAKLDDEQFEWLADDLAKVPAQTPVLVLSHIPILGASVFFDGENEKTGDWVVPGSWMHLDARRIDALFLKHPNVKVCLSGHIHLRDAVEYNGVSYICNGAVCAGWWKGINYQCDFGYGVTKLYADGSFHNEYATYGWTGHE